MSEAAVSYRWPIAIAIEPERDWEGSVVASSVEVAIISAIQSANLQPGELLHYIHIGPPKAVP